MTLPPSPGAAAPATLVPVSQERHGHLRYLPLTSLQFAAGSTAISLFASELGRVAVEFPIVFTAESEGYFPAALMGFRQNQNLFVDSQGKWLASYLPAVWRRGPFRLARVKESDQWVLCLDESSPHLSRERGDPLFDEQGKPLPFLQQATQFLVQLEAERLSTLAACAELDRLGLITPWELSVVTDDGARVKLGGLFRIDEAKFQQCSGEELAVLLRTGALAMIFAHGISLQKMARLRELAEARLAALAQPKAVPPDKLDLDRVFGMVEDDPFIF